MVTMNTENRTKTMRVLLANEPLSYREVMAGALDELRPGTEVVALSPEMMDAAVLRLRPQVVLCDHVSPVIEEHVLVWAELYPDGSGCSRVSVLHELSSVEDMQLEDVFALLDRAEMMLQQD